MELLSTTRSIENPVTGERFEIRDESGDALRFDYYLEPGGFAVGRIDHAHPRQTEAFEVRAGRLGVRIDGDEWTATPGTKFAIPPKTAHTVRNDGDEEMHAVVEIGRGRTLEPFFETMAGLARDGKTNRWGLPGPLQLAVIANDFREEIYFPAAPVTLQRAVAAAVAPVGRRLGYRSRYARYGDESA